MNRTAIINTLFEKYKFKTYLEVGVEYTENNFDKVNAEFKECVDPAPKGYCTYKMTSDEFFETYPDKRYDVIFIDGMQTKEQGYKDITNSLLCLNDNGFILLHCTDPRHEHLTVSYEEYLQVGGCWLGTMYKAFMQIKHELPEWSCFVVGGGWGVGVITPRGVLKNERALPYRPDLSWKHYNRNRRMLLQWTSFEDYQNIIKNDQNI